MNYIMKSPHFNGNDIFASLSLEEWYFTSLLLRLSPSLVPLGGEQYHSFTRVKGIMTHGTTQKINESNGNAYLKLKICVV